MADFIAPISFGLGDLVVSLPAVQGLVRAGRKVYLVCRSEVQVALSERISGLAGTITETELERRGLVDGETYHNLRDHPLQRDYWWGSPEFERDHGGMLINDILRKICTDKQIPAAFDAVSPLIYTPRADFFNKVVFLPGSDGVYKCWPATHWQALHAYLRAAGLETIVVGEPQNSAVVAELVGAGLPWQPTVTLADALDALSSCRLVVGVDTGLTHLSVQQGRPTVALYRHRSVFVRPYAHCFPVYASPCHPQCVARSLSCATNFLTALTGFTPRTWTCCLPQDESCMSKISVEQVVRIIGESLSAGSRPGSGGGRSDRPC